MYSKQLLIKINENMLRDLQNISKQMDIKVSTFARMILKNYLNEKEMDRQDIEVIKRHRNEKTYDFNEFINELYDEYQHDKKSKKRT